MFHRGLENRGKGIASGIEVAKLLAEGSGAEHGMQRRRKGLKDRGQGSKKKKRKENNCLETVQKHRDEEGKNPCFFLMFFHLCNLVGSSIYKVPFLLGTPSNHLLGKSG